MSDRPTPPTLLGQWLDERYHQVADPLMADIYDTMTTGVMAERLNQLDQAATELEASDQKFAPGNPVFRALLADFGIALLASQSLIGRNASTFEAIGIQAAAPVARRLALPGLDDATLQQLGIQWRTPDTDVLGALVNYTSKASWQALIGQYGTGIVDAVNRLLIRGVLDGHNPRTIARDARQMVTTMPVWQANNLARTLQLYSYRTATSANFVANADLLEPYAIRRATLDKRVCLACIALSGTRVPIDQPLQEHWSGRCVMIPVVRGRTVNVPLGESWLRSQPEAAQRDLMGHAAFEAWRAGAVRLRDFARTVQDATFGAMIRESSLRGLLGNAAEQYYKKVA